LLNSFWYKLYLYQNH